MLVAGAALTLMSAGTALADELVTSVQSVEPVCVGEQVTIHGSGSLYRSAEGPLYQDGAEVTFTGSVGEATVATVTLAMDDEHDRAARRLDRPRGRAGPDS